MKFDTVTKNSKYSKTNKNTYSLLRNLKLLRNVSDKQ